MLKSTLKGLIVWFSRTRRSIISWFVKRYPERGDALALFILNEIGKEKKKYLPDFWKLPSPIEHSQLMQIFYDDGLLTKREIHNWINGLFADRRLDEFESIINSPLDGLDDLFLCHAIRLKHYRGRPHNSDSEVLELLESSRRDNTYLAHLVLGIAVHQFCVTENLDFLRIALGKDNEFAHKLTKVSVMGSIRLLQKHHCDREALSLLRSFLASSPDHDYLELYFMELIISLVGKDSKEFKIPSDWRSTLISYKKTFSSDKETLLEEFQNYLFDPLEKISETEDYMDIRIDSKIKQMLQEFLLSSIRQQKPLSLVRLGDGEAYSLPSPFIDNVPKNAFDRDNEVRELHWWGSAPSNEIRERIKSASFEAFAKADILGIPSIYRLIRDYKPKGVGADRSNRGLATVLNGIHNHLPNNERILTEERCHQVIFNEDFLRTLVKEADHILVVSCWTKEQFTSDVFDAADFIHVPPHTKVFDKTNERVPLYEVYEEINDAVARSARPGTLMLLGAGLIGKIFIQTAKEKGAVALDVGSVLDYLASRKTRSLVDAV